MNLTQKKNCNGCKAGWYESQPFFQRCDLGYLVKSGDYIGIPQEPCYKPLTNDKYMKARRILFPRQ